MVTKVLSGDIQITDLIVPLKARAELDALDPHIRERYVKLNNLINQVLEEQKVSRGQKARLTPEQFAMFAAATSGLVSKPEPGGSSANTLTTLKRMLGRRLDVDMIGVVGNDMDSNRIRAGLTDAGINLIPDPSEFELAPGEGPQSATSFVFTEGNSRTILTYPGNARKLLKPHMITQDLIDKNDVVFVQGSLWEKLEEDFPDKLLKLRYGNNPEHPSNVAKEIWLALPTHAKFRDNMPPSRYRYLIPSADVVMGNNEELMRIYETGNFEEAIRRLQHDLAQRDSILEKDRKLKHPKPPVAFITCGEEGAMVITPERITRIPPSDVSKIPKLYTLGAGDTSYAGFLFGHVAGLVPEKSAALGMQLAGAKLQFDSARIPTTYSVREGQIGPREVLKKFSARGAALLEEADRLLGTDGVGEDSGAGGPRQLVGTTTRR